MRIELDQLPGRDVYGLMIQTIIPRPIAWILSDNGDKTFNLAPFSYFNGVTSRPPTLSISIGRKRDKSKKDTWRNIEERGHFVVHIASTDMAEPLAATAASLEFGDSEVTQNDLQLIDEPDWSLPRLSKSRIALLCRKYQIIEIGEAPQGLVIGEIKSAWVCDEIASETEGSNLPAIDASRLNPLARLGGDDYSQITEPFTVKRPD